MSNMTEIVQLNENGIFERNLVHLPVRLPKISGNLGECRENSGRLGETRGNLGKFSGKLGETRGKLGGNSGEPQGKLGETQSSSPGICWKPTCLKDRKPGNFFEWAIS